MQLKPQPRVLVIWRLLISALALLPAFFISLFLKVGGLPWIISNTVWIIAYLYYFLYHLPRYYKNFQIEMTDRYLTVRSGVFYANVHKVPCRHVQFMARSANPFSQLFGLVTLHVVMAGGRVRLPGLRPEDADAITEQLSRQME